MKTMKILTVGLLFMGMMTLTACFKEGPTGPKGEDGNANVIGTNEVTISNWTQAGAFWSAGISVPSITQNVVNTGTVQVFAKYGSEWWALPDLNGNNMTYFGYDEGHITLMNSNTDNSTPSHPGSKIFRIVVISSSNLTANPGVDWTDYEQVKKALELAE